jgi:hypothetical protein
VPRFEPDPRSKAVMSDKKPVDFPPLLSDEEIDRLVVRKPEAPPPRPAPLDVVRASFPRIAERIAHLWGAPQLDGYLRELLIDSRGNRQGFPPHIVAALLEISEQHQRQFGFAGPPAEDWADKARRTER